MARTKNGGEYGPDVRDGAPSACCVSHLRNPASPNGTGVKALRPLTPSGSARALTPTPPRRAHQQRSGQQERADQHT